MHDTKNERIRFLESEEGRVFLLGSCMLIAWAALLVAMSRFWNEQWLEFVKIGPAHVFGGRAASVAFGLSKGFGRLLTAVIVVYLDVMVMLLVYPFLIYSYKYLVERKFYHQHVKPVIDSAQKSVTRFRRWKITGVFFFVWAPFWMTGVIGGSVLGFLLGLRTWVNLLTVTLGTTAAVICWTLAFNEVFKGIDPKIHIGIVIAIVAVALGMRAVKTRK